MGDSMTAASEWPGPYAAIAKYYAQNGWIGALPLPPGKKGPVPSGYTGHEGLDPTMRDIDRWIAESPNSNIGLRMPQDILGIDVDAYEGKSGGYSLETAEAKMGPLPPTWRTSSRYAEDTVSGIRYYRVPEGMKWPNTIGSGIETIRRGHRYAVAPPSIHPDTHLPYQWIDPQGNVGFNFPRPSSLPWLPDSWIEGLTAGEMAGPAPARSKPPEHANAWLTPGHPCKAVLAQLERFRQALSSKGSRHDMVRDLLLAVIFLGQQSHQGVGPAVKVMHDEYVAMVGKDRDGDVEMEWSRMQFGAFEIISASPRELEVCGQSECGRPAPMTAPAALAGPEMIVDPDLYRKPEEMDDLDAFFDLRPELAHIRDFARARMASPWATLGAVLIRVVCQIQPLVVLPAIVGKQASLNLFIGVVGPSGSGKQAAEGAAEEAFYYGGEQTVIPLGSGEGLVGSYIKYVPPKKDMPATFETLNTSVLFRASEVDTLAALKGRSSSTLMPAIRDAWAGDQLGFGYVTAEKRLLLPQHSYRMGLIVGVQPERAGTLLDGDESDGGTPQRFLWLPARDPDIPDITPEEPKRWQWKKPEFNFSFTSAGNGRKPLNIPHEVIEIVRQAALARHRGQTDALDGHALLQRLKVAAALAFLDMRPEVLMEDWELAGIVMAKSDRTRAEVVAELSAKEARRTEAKLHFERDKTVVVEDAKADSGARRMAQTLRKKLRPDEWVGRSELRKSLAAGRRELFDEVIDDFVSEGWVEREVIEHAKVPEGVTRYRLRMDQR